jgi:isoamylase
MFDVRVWAPLAATVEVETADGERTHLHHDGDHWVGAVALMSRYRLHVDGGPGLVDPMATQVWFGEHHERLAPDAWAVAAPWPAARPQRWTTRPLVVAEAHVRGLTMRLDRPDAGTFTAAATDLPRLASLGVSVLELLPIHQFDPAEGNYWGYMPLAFGAVHGHYGSADDVAALVATAHEHDIEVWVDVVVNHTTEEDEHGPTLSLRGLADADYYARDSHGRYLNDAGCGNVIDATSPPAQRLVMAGLDRLADLGIDGFRFDLAAVLARDPEFVRAIGDWGERRGVRLVAEPWDLARYLLGRAFPDRRWAQWNGKFRDDVRGFLRGEGGLVPALMQRVQGSPDLFDQPLHSVNFLTAHDGFTMYDLVAYDRKRNDANGWGGADGTDDNRSWNSGWEGDVDVPADVMGVRLQQLRNAMCLLLLSHGTPMFVLGDEFGRTQGGNNNPYNQDNETSWVDWGRRDCFADHEAFVRRLIEFRAAYPVLWRAEPWGSDVEWFGATGAPDMAVHSRSLAWHVDGLYVVANMWWESVEFRVQAPGPWVVVLDTSDPAGFVAPTPADASLVVTPRSIVVLATPPPPTDPTPELQTAPPKFVPKVP